MTIQEECISILKDTLDFQTKLTPKSLKKYLQDNSNLTDEQYNLLYPRLIEVFGEYKLGEKENDNDDWEDCLVEYED